jgi:hypothetical protein
MTIDNHFILSVIHLILVVPLFLYVGFKRADTPNWLYLALLSIGFVIFIYHSYKLVLRLQNKSPIWVNAIHIAIIAPLLVYIGYHKKQTPRSAYEIILLLGFSAAGYHLFSLVKQLDTHPDSFIS